MRAAVVDALGTLFELEPLRGRLVEAGAPPSALETWFARLLHGAAALTLAGEFEPFPALAASTLCSVLARHDLDTSEAAGVVEGLSELEPYPDAERALSLLAEGGVEIAVLTNGSAEATRALLERSGLDRLVSHVATTEDVRAYKPDPRPYRHALGLVGVAARDATMIAAHGWDTVGARAVGMQAVWVKRLERCWPLPVEAAPAADDLQDAARLVLSSAAAGAAP